MDKFEAQYSFWASFGVPAYEENSVPDLDNVTFPYITYQAVSGLFDTDSTVSASIWTRSNSWDAADALALAMEARLKNGGAVINYDGGIIWITAAATFSQSMGEPDDDRIKRKLLTVTLHFA